MQTLQDFNSDPTSYIHTTHTINAFFVKTNDASVVSWIQYITSVLLYVILYNNLFHHTTFWIPRTNLPTSLRYFCLDIISYSLPTSWKFYTQLSNTTDFGECISAHRYSFHIYQKSDKTVLYPHQPASLHPTPDIFIDYFQCLDVSHMNHPNSEVLRLHELSLDSAGYKDHNTYTPHILDVLYPSLDTKLNHIHTSSLILKYIFPSKELLGRHFGVPAQITSTSWHACCITTSELLHIYSITIPKTHLHSNLQSNSLGDLLDDLLLFRLPWTMDIQVNNQSEKLTPLSTLSPIAKVLNATQFNATSSQTPPAPSTGMTLIRPTPIQLLSSSIFSQLKRNGLHLILPQFILSTEQPLRSTEYKTSRKIGSPQTYFG